MTYQNLAKAIVDHLGGKDNILSVTNCMTRVRIKVKDKTYVNKSVLENVEGVLGVVDEETIQVVVGPGTAKKVADEMISRYDLNQQTSSDWKSTKETVKAKQKQSGMKKFLETIANIFIPMIPAIIAAGLFNGFSSLIGQMIAPKEGFWYVTQVVFSLIGTSFMGYFAIYTGINAANEFGATPALGGMVGAMSIAGPLIDLSTYFGLYHADQPLESILTTGKGGIMGVIIGVWLLARIERKVRSFVPGVLDLILTPVITLLVTSIIFTLGIMPVAGFLSDRLVAILNVIINSENTLISILSGYILAAIFLPMVLMGLHHGLIPIYAIQLEQLGGVTLFPVLAMAGAGQVGAAIAIYRKAKRRGDTRLQQVIAGALPAGMLGVGEPLIYGVTLPLGKPFITAGLGSGIGGAYVRAMGVSSVAWGPSGLVAIPLMSTPSGMLHFFIGIILSYMGGFIFTSIFMKDEDFIN